MLFGRTAKPRVVELGPADAATCARLHAAAFTHGWDEVEFERLLAASSAVGDAALAGNASVGFILSRAAADEAEVLTVVVAQRWRGRGIGRLLLDQHLIRLSLSRVRRLFLEVGDDNVAARALYSRAGFEEVGRRPAYYPGARGGQPVDALVLKRQIG